VLKLREPHRQTLLRGHAAIAVLLDKQEMLRLGQPARNDHSSPSSQLMDQGRRNEVRSRCHNHLVERSVLGPAVIAIGNLDRDIAATLAAESLPRLLPKLFNDFDAEHFASQLRENCRLITETGADL